MLSGPVLLVILAAAILFIVGSTSLFKLHPFFALILTAYGVGLAVRMPAGDIVKTISEGFGGLMGSIGLVIILGTIIGVFLERSGAAIVIADAVLRWVGKQRPALAMSMIGYIVSIPVFCDSGFVILSSLNKALSRRTGVALPALAVALSTGLYATHVLVPPTPGPLAAAANLGAANLGLIIVLGLLTAIPATAAGLLWARRFTGRGPVAQERGEVDPTADWEQLKAKYGRLPGVPSAFAPLVIPILLIALASVANFPGAPLGQGGLKAFLSFVGTPITALLIGVGLCLFLIERVEAKRVNDWVVQAMKDAAGILIITGAGGALGKILSVTPIGTYLGAMLAQYNLGIFLPFVIAAALKTAQGSSTVALVTTSALVAPMLPALGFASEMGRVLMVLAVGAGAMVASHANDSFFWVVSQFSEMEVGLAYRAQTVATLIQGLVAILTVAVLAWIFL